MALTGGIAPNGKQILLALEIWRDDVNAKGGLLGRPVELVYYDDQTNPAKVPGIYTKLIESTRSICWSAPMPPTWSRRRSRHHAGQQDDDRASSPST